MGKQMKTPEEIKKWLDMCHCDYEECDTCSFADFCNEKAQGLAYIQQLEREKEAMLRDMKAWPACDACKHRNLLCTQKPCSECREAGNGKTVMWEWRGVEEKNYGENQ